MSRFDRSQQEDEFRIKLQQEASASRPVFSESRHERLQQAVRAAGTTAAVGATSPRSRRDIPWWAGLAAALCLVLAISIAWQITHRPSADSDRGDSIRQIVQDVRPDERHSPLKNGRDTEHLPFPSEIPPLLAFVDNSATSAQWAFLDHDVKVMLNWAVQRLPAPCPPSSIPEISPGQSHHGESSFREGES